MNLIQIDRIDLETSQAGIERLPHIVGTSAFLSFAHFHSEFRGDDRFIATSSKRRTEKLFALPGAVNIRGVEEVNASIQRGVDNGIRARRVCPPAEVIASNTHERNSKRPNLAIFHEVSLAHRRPTAFFGLQIFDFPSRHVDDGAMQKPFLLLSAILLVPQTQDTYRPTATVRDLMATMVGPSADHVWKSVSVEVSRAGMVERRPQNDQEWAELRKQTLLLIESMNLLAIPGRPVAKAGEKPANPQAQAPEQIEALINSERANWVTLSRRVQDAATQALAAVDAKDSSAVMEAGGRIYEACKSCHQKYWDLPGRR
jgi:hypothetical protein